MAAAATLTVSVTGKNKPHNNNEHIRRNRENSRRRQAALLFLSNISLDGRPVQSTVAESSDSEGNDLGSPCVPVRLPADSTGRHGMVHSLAASGSCSTVRPPSTPRIGVLNHVPPILVLPSDSGFDDMGAGGLVLERRTASFSSPGTLLSASPSRGSLLPSPVGPRKSSTLLSVHSCTSVSSEPRHRSRNLSGGSSRPRLTKKIHFIKNMRPYDTRGSRIVLICAKKSLCAAFSVLPYGESFHISDPMLHHPRRRHSSGNISSLEMLPGLEGFHLDPYSKSVSYAQFLYPTNALVRERPSCSSVLQLPASHSCYSGLGARGPPPLETG
ncbi:unnamed protein product [Lota lota]